MDGKFFRSNKFGSKKFWIKKFWIKKILDQKNVGKIFWIQKKFGFEKMLSPIKWDPKNLGPKSLVKIGSVTAEILLI